MEQNFPKVSVVISNYNGAALLPETLDSLGRLQYPDYEVVLVDAGSSDASMELVQARYPWVKPVPLRTKVGIATALNIGVKHSSGEILVLHYNTDETATPKWLQNLVEALRGAPKGSIVGGIRLVYGTEDLLEDCGYKFYPFGISTRRYHQRRLADCPKDPLQSVDFVGALGLYRSTYDFLGPLDETFFLYGDDAEYCMRARRLGGRVFVTPRAITWHKGAQTIGRNRVSRHYHLRGSMLRIVLKHFPLRLFPVALLGFCGLALLDLIMMVPLPAAIGTRARFETLAQRRTPAEFLSTLKAYSWSLSTLRTIIRERRQMSRRKATSLS